MADLGVPLFQETTIWLMSGGQNYLLPAMDMAKVGGPLSVVKVALPWYVWKSGIGKWAVPYRLWRLSHKFEHPKSTPYYFSLPLILTVTHMYLSIYHYLPVYCRVFRFSLQCCKVFLQTSFATVDIWGTRRFKMVSQLTSHSEVRR